MPKPPTAAQQTLDAIEGLPFSPEDIPPAFQKITPDIRINAGGDVRWGWKQWIAIAPRVSKHIKAHGRIDLRKAIIAAQNAQLPREHRRSEKAISVALSPTGAGVDIVKLIGFIAAMLQAAPPAPPKTVASRFHAPGAEPAQIPAPVQTPPPQDRLQALLAGDRQDIPPQFKATPLDARHGMGRDGTGVVWGWKQWAALLPLLRDELAKGERRTTLAGAVFAAQTEALPPSLQRTRKHLQIRCAPSSRPDAYALLKFLQGLATAEAAPVAPPATAAQPVAEVVQERTEPAAVSLPLPSRPTAAGDDLAGFLATPIGAFVPAFKAFMRDALRDLLIPHRDFLAETVRAAVIDVVGAPSPGHVPPQPVPAPAVQQQPAEPPPPEPDPVPEKVITPDHYVTKDEPSNAEAKPEAAEPEPLRKLAQEQQPVHTAAHDLESQLAAAAKALGIPAAPKQTVLVVGLHPKVEQEVEKFYGKAFRFMFKRPDAFNSSNDVPASTDIILVHRKTLTKELVQMARRDAIPVQHVQNNSAAVLGALREFNPEQSHGLPVQ